MWCRAMIARYTFICSLESVFLSWVLLLDQFAVLLLLFDAVVLFFVLSSFRRVLKYYTFWRWSLASMFFSSRFRFIIGLIRLESTTLHKYFFFLFQLNWLVDMLTVEVAHWLRLAFYSLTLPPFFSFYNELKSRFWIPKARYQLTSARKMFTLFTLSGSKREKPHNSIYRIKYARVYTSLGLLQTFFLQFHWTTSFASLEANWKNF